MKLKKEAVKVKILIVSKNEFLTKGFDKTSVRKIASLAGVTTGSIYTYFKNKDEIFDEIVRPAIRVIESNFIREDLNSALQKREMIERTTLEKMNKNVEKFCLDVEAFRDEFKLLFFCAGGSNYKNYRGMIISMYIQYLLDWFQAIEIRDQNIKIREEISEPFMHALAGFFVSAIEEIITHIHDEETRNLFVGQLSFYLYHGFSNLFEKLVQVK